VGLPNAGLDKCGVSLLAREAIGYSSTRYLG
jgi:hypothetical protein